MTVSVAADPALCSSQRQNAPRSSAALQRPTRLDNSTSLYGCRDCGRDAAGGDSPEMVAAILLQHTASAPRATSDLVQASPAIRHTLPADGRGLIVAVAQHGSSNMQVMREVN